MKKTEKWLMFMGALMLSGCVEKPISQTSIIETDLAVPVTTETAVTVVKIDALETKKADKQVTEADLPVANNADFTVEGLDVSEIQKNIEAENKQDEDLSETLESALIETGNSSEEVAPVIVVAAPIPSTEQTEMGTESFSYEVGYQTPKGETPMTVSFIVTDGKVASFNLKGNPAHQISIGNQLLFKLGVTDLVVGKNVLEIADFPQVVNGSSLTSTGFNKALIKLRAEA